MIEIYTDASVGKNKAVATCFILTDKNFIGHKVSEFKDVQTSIDGELKGALASILYAESAVGFNDNDITLYSDSIALINLLKANPNRTHNKQALLYLKDLVRLRSIVNRNNIKLSLIKGHDIDHNPNKVVDLISNSVLRFGGKE